MAFCQTHEDKHKSVSHGTGHTELTQASLLYKCNFKLILPNITFCYNYYNSVTFKRIYFDYITNIFGV